MSGPTAQVTRNNSLGRLAAYARMWRILVLGVRVVNTEASVEEKNSIIN